MLLNSTKTIVFGLYEIILLLLIPIKKYMFSKFVNTLLKIKANTFY